MRGQGQDALLLDGGEPESLLSEGCHVGEEAVDLLLQARNLVGDRLELIRVLEVGGATVWSVEALEIEVAASLTGSLTIALDLPSFAFVAVDRELMVSWSRLTWEASGEAEVDGKKDRSTYQAIEIYYAT